MGEPTEQFKAHFKAYYGYHFCKQKPDYSRCAESVVGSGRGDCPHQCNRKNGHGPDGAFCKLHDPIAVAAKRAKQIAAWNAKWATEERERAFINEAKQAVRDIADGHNDPRSLCAEIMARFNGEAQ